MRPIVVLAALAILVLYPLSVGPVTAAVVVKGWLPDQVVLLYVPLHKVMEWVPPIGKVLLRYIVWWTSE